jgi:hypothetical protein
MGSVKASWVMVCFAAECWGHYDLLCALIASLSNGVLDIRRVTLFRLVGAGNVAFSFDLWFWLNMVSNH